jgi:endonuclease VIII
MPEGPEIRRAADRLAAAVVGEPLKSAWFAFASLQTHASALAGRRIEAIVPHGKALLTRFDHGWTLYSHNQLYGVWKIANAGERPDTTRALRVVLETERSAILLYSASDIEMWRSDEIHRHPFLMKLGPDVLDPTLKATTIAKRLLEPAFRKRALGALLLDQAFLAGMGNYLRSEVLFAARLLPERRPDELSTAQRNALARELLAIPRRSYATRGIEAADGMREDYLTDTPDGFRFLVFDREGQACPTCKAKIQRREVGTRRLYFCPRCQS